MRYVSRRLSIRLPNQASTANATIIITMYCKTQAYIKQQLVARQEHLPVETLSLSHNIWSPTGDSENARKHYCGSEVCTCIYIYSYSEYGIWWAQTINPIIAR